MSDDVGFYNTLQVLELRSRKKRLSSTFMEMSNQNQITLFKLSTSSGNDMEHPVRPNDRFSGVVVLQLSRPVYASQVTLEFTGTERRMSALKGLSKFIKTQLFSIAVTVWKPTHDGPSPSSVLSDGIHVFNFTCQMPNVNYPQSIERQEYDYRYTLRALVKVPLDQRSEYSIAVVEKDVHCAPLITQSLNLETLNIMETLYFEKKGKKGKAAVELRAGITGHQILPGSKVKIDMSIKELSSTNWTKVVARLMERTNCREGTKSTFSQPHWSADRELAHTELVRSSVYNFFLNDELTGADSSESTTKNGSTVTNETMYFPIPLMACSPLGSDHLEFTHYIRLEVVLPNWRSSDRAVYTEFPVKLLTCDPQSALSVLNRQMSMLQLERSNSTDAQSFVSTPQSPTLNRAPSITSFQGPRNGLAGSLPVAYYEVHPVQRPYPVLSMLKQSNYSGPGDVPSDLVSVSKASGKPSTSRSLKHSTMGSSHKSEYSFDGRSMHSSMQSSMSTAEDPAEERYRARPLPPPPPSMLQMPSQSSVMQVSTSPPPLPDAPMPTSNNYSPTTLVTPVSARYPEFTQQKLPPLPPQSPTHSAYQGGLIPSPYSSAHTSTNSAGAYEGNLMLQPVPSKASSGGGGVIKDLISAPFNVVKHDTGLIPVPQQPAVSLPVPPGDVLSGGFGFPTFSKSKKSQLQRPHTSAQMTMAAASPPPDLPGDDFDSDDDAGYFKSSLARWSSERERANERGLFRLRKNSSIKVSR